MDSTSLNHYEERLYSVFKTFDVDNEEALNEGAVLALCDALQLEQRGAQLVQSLFERRDQRVTFAQFRQGLLAVLGDPAPSAADPLACAASSATPVPLASDPPHSDEDSSGREVAPKFVFGSKKYGRRSRPCLSQPGASSPVPPPGPAQPPDDVPLDHSSRVDCERALQLCRQLQMDGIDRQLIERIFEAIPARAGEVTVGEFFDRLNDTLSSSIDDAGPAGDSTVIVGEDFDEEEALPAEAVVEAWERAGVGDARRLLEELAGAGAGAAAAVRGGRLQGALRERAEGRAGERGVLTAAALALAALRRERAQLLAAELRAERDRLRADLDEANRRARLLASEVDEHHARLEAERVAGLRRAERSHADALRRLEDERATERERAAAERDELRAEAARREAGEARLRGELAAQAGRARALDERAGAAERRAGAAEREAARLQEALRAAEGAARGAAQQAERARAELAARLGEQRAENQRLRDRCDELGALLDRPQRAGGGGERADRQDAAPHTLLLTPANMDGESPPVSLETGTDTEARTVTNTDDEVAELRAQLTKVLDRHNHEKQKLEDLVKELEASLELMREEYERCEEYWSGKLREERALLRDEQRAGDERLALLADKVSEYERQFSRLPAIAETPALERQAAELDAAAELLQHRERRAASREQELQRVAEELSRRADEVTRQRAELTRRERDLTRLAATLDALRRTQGGGCGRGGGGGVDADGGVGGGLRARALRAEAGAARLAARLAAADLLVKDLYVENCLLGPRRRL